MRQPKPRWNEISGLSLLIFCLPCIYVVISTSSILNQPPDTYAGLIRIQPGQAFFTDEESARKIPENRQILTCEDLNRKLSEICLAEPNKAPQLKTYSKKQVKELIIDALGIEGADLAAKSDKYNINWVPSFGEHGIFTLPEENPPSKSDQLILNNVFGIIPTTQGEERTTYETENLLNTTLRKAEEERLIQSYTLEKSDNPLSKFLNITIKKGLLPIEQGPKLIGTCQALNINFTPSKKLFLTKETAKKIDEWNNTKNDIK